MLVNTPATFGGMGITTNLFPAMTLGSGSTGRGSTSDNVSPMNLIYVRKVGYGVRRVEDLFGSKVEGEAPAVSSAEACTKSQDELLVLKSLLDKVLENH